MAGGRLPARERAIAHVAARAAGGPVDPALRVTLNFHPDRLAGGQLLLAALARDGVYRSQFETGISSGGLTAYPGGARWGWESRMFGAAYDDQPPGERPRYGALNYRRRPVGGAPRFGSAHLRLTAATLARTTFCYPDSVLEPDNFGTVRAMALIPLAEADRIAGQDPLDDCIEAHVHGPVRPDRDAEALVLDPCFRGTDVEAAAALVGCPVEWHGGFRLAAADLRRYPDYRGREFTEIGLALARDGWLDPAIIGDASRAALHPEQALKRVWHYLAAFGSPEDREV
ncbi:MAG TPA: DUF3626 domain-containing protein [Streptosporangiaceae bacterium]